MNRQYLNLWGNNELQKYAFVDLELNVIIKSMVMAENRFFDLQVEK